MRKIEREMCAAVKERRNWKSGNTEVKVRKDGATTRVTVYLHGNDIYETIEDSSTGFKKAGFTLAGWNTNTTRSRLNALGVGVYQRHWTPMFKGMEIDSKEWCNV